MDDLPVHHAFGSLEHPDQEIPANEEKFHEQHERKSNQD